MLPVAEVVVFALLQLMQAISNNAIKNIVFFHACICTQNIENYTYKHRLVEEYPYSRWRGYLTGAYALLIFPLNTNNSYRASHSCSQPTNRIGKVAEKSYGVQVSDTTKML